MIPNVGLLRAHMEKYKTVDWWMVTSDHQFQGKLQAAVIDICIVLDELLAEVEEARTFGP